MLVAAPTMVSGRVPANLLGAGTKRLTHVPNPVPAMNIVFKAGATVAATNSNLILRFRKCFCLFLFILNHCQFVFCLINTNALQ